MMRKPPLDPEVLKLLSKLPLEQQQVLMEMFLSPKTKYINDGGREGFHQSGKDNFLVYPRMEEQVDPLLQAIENKRPKARYIGPTD